MSWITLLLAKFSKHALIQYWFNLLSRSSGFYTQTNGHTRAGPPLTLFMIVPIFNSMMRIDKSILEGASIGA